ncbi:F-box only protein 36-like [Clavelina lepadiformis]|uniref:F-box domain-containing protein n=1 Tax=Clavelina lepadiformis TaxID=159417 RepID=A0ABP0H4E7_CLALP
MLSLVKNGVLLDVSEQAPSPSKDFVNMMVTTNEVIWRYWRINPQCLKSDVKIAPTETKENHHDFLHNLDLHSEVKRVFGENTLTYVKSLCEGHFDHFVRISNALQIYIISFMDLEDIAKLSQTNKHFHELCDSEQLWEHIVERHCDTVTPDMKLYAGEVGWKHVFFTNKLQLQAQIRRHQQRTLFADAKSH